MGVYCAITHYVEANLTLGEELSEEDAQLKSELDMLVERITVRIFLVAARRKLTTS